MRTGISFTVSPIDRQRLTALVRDRNAPQKHVWRAEIILLSADGVGPVEIRDLNGRATWVGPQVAIAMSDKRLTNSEADQRPAMLESIAKALTRRLLQDNPNVDIHEVLGRVTAFIKAVHWRISHTTKLSQRNSCKIKHRTSGALVAGHPSTLRVGSLQAAKR